MPERQIVVVPGIQMGKLKICRNIGVFGRFFALQMGHAAFLAQRIESELVQKQTLSDGRQAAFGVGGRRYLLIRFGAGYRGDVKTVQMFQQLQSDFRFQKGVSIGRINAWSSSIMERPENTPDIGPAFMYRSAISVMGSDRCVYSPGFSRISKYAKMRFVLVHKVFQQTYFAKRQQGFIGSHARASAAAQG